MSRLRSVDLRMADAIGASRVITLLAILLSMLLLTGCGGEEAPREQRPAGEGEEDVRPLSREQLEMQAEAMVIRLRYLNSTSPAFVEFDPDCPAKVNSRMEPHTAAKPTRLA